MRTLSSNLLDNMTNREVAELFLELADLLDLAGELPFKSSSYRKVAAALSALEEPYDRVVSNSEWDKIPGAGKAIKEKLATLAETGQFPTLEKWRKHEMASHYSWMAALNLKPRPLGMLIRKLQAENFLDLLDKLRGYDIKKLTGQSRDVAKDILRHENNK